MSKPQRKNSRVGELAGTLKIDPASHLPGTSPPRKVPKMEESSATYPRPSTSSRPSPPPQNTKPKSRIKSNPPERPPVPPSSAKPRRGSQPPEPLNETTPLPISPRAQMTNKFVKAEPAPPTPSSNTPAKKSGSRVEVLASTLNINPSGLLPGNPPPRPAKPPSSNPSSNEPTLREQLSGVDNSIAGNFYHSLTK